MDWLVWLDRVDLVAAGTLAATGITAAATMYALFQRWHERPRPAWDFSASWAGFREDADFEDGYGGRADEVRCTLANNGDGAAYAVRVRTKGCRAYQMGVDPGWPMIAAGETQTFSLYFDEADGCRIVEGATLTVEWTHPPRRKKVRSLTFVPAETRPPA